MDKPISILTACCKSCHQDRCEPFFGSTQHQFEAEGCLSVLPFSIAFQYFFSTSYLIFQYFFSIYPSCVRKSRTVTHEFKANMPIVFDDTEMELQGCSAVVLSGEVLEVKKTSACSGTN